MPGKYQNFIQLLEDILVQASYAKVQEPKTEETRHWAVVYTELEKVSAYVKTYLKE